MRAGLPLARAASLEQRSFDELAFGDVDAAVLADIGRFALTGLVAAPAHDEAPRWTPLSAILSERHLDALKGDHCFWNPRVDRAFARSVGASVRYGAVLAGLHVDERSARGEPARQFSATTFCLGDGTYFVAYRGTDLSLTGWREDFDMLCEEDIPSQHDALAYLHDAARVVDGPLRVGGHSKGGTLAEHAVLRAHPDVRARVEGVYNLDGPGLRAADREGESYRRMQARLHKVIPRSSFYGLLFTDPASCRIVASSGWGLAAHPPGTWHVRTHAFVPAPSLSPRTASAAAQLQAWLAELPLEERRGFIDDAFAVLSSTGADTLAGLPFRLVAHAKTTARAYCALPREGRRRLRRVTRSFVGRLAASVARPEHVRP